MARILIAALAAALLSKSPAASAAEPGAWAKENMAELVALYRHLHSNPELSNHEERTAARIAQEWKNAGATVTTGVGGHGVVGVIKNGPGPVLMLRTDLDALPVTEQTELVYASKVKVKTADGAETGVMHACGHDIHMTNLVGVARYLAANKDRWSGTLVLVGQPAEEMVQGAARMIKDGLYTRFPKPDFAVALHVDSALEAGKVGYRAGPILANVDSVDITMRGRGGHGAAPHMTIDPIVQAAQLVVDLQTLVSREANPVEPAVVTVGSIHGGTKRNVISDSCRLQLTVRSFSMPLREQLLAGIERKAKAVAAGARAPEPIIEVLDESVPAVVNDQKLVERLVPAMRRTLGEKNVVVSEPAMVSEDFALYREGGVPIAMFRLGSIERRRLAGLTRGGLPPPSLHSPLYYPDPEETLETGIAAIVAAAVELLPGRKGSRE
jgi:hippurate hydrolase